MTPAVLSRPLLPDSFASRVQAAAEQAAAQRLPQRLFEKDATLWTTQPDEQRAILNRLGWLGISRIMQPHLASIRSAAEDVRKAGFTHALLLGMGGSSLFSEVCRAIFGVATGWLDLAVLDSTDPVAILAARRRAPLERTLIIVSSKSGSTTEVSSLCEYFYEELTKAVGDRAGQHCVAITDAGTPLEALAKARRFRHVFVHGPATGADVGGRFSALTCFGLFPAALLGVDIVQLLDRAEEMLAACGPSVPPAENPGLQLAVALHEAASQGRDTVTLVSAPALAQFNSWAEQLVAESTGKSGKGLIPIDQEPLRAPGAYPADRLFVELQLTDAVDRKLEQAVEALADAGHPVVRLRWRDRYDLGGEVMRWAVATAFTASLMRINAFDEPNVQESKDRTKQLLHQYAKDRALPQEPPLKTEGGLVLFGNARPAASPVGANSSIPETVRAFFQEASPGAYLVLSSFLPRTPELDAAVVALRAKISETLRLTTLLGYGPRYLHSTGQLHKGGPDRARVLFLTADDPADVPVPGQPYSFSVVKQAQALGDYQALKERNRPVLRAHLGRSPREALTQLEAAFRRA